MADVQRQFYEFHDAIKLDDENDILRQKRAIIVNRLKQKLSDKAPSFKDVIQGSYAMSTGIKPLDGEYDIDVGIRFETSKDEWDDPVELKKLIADALKGYTKKDPEIKDACVKVTYLQDGEETFHVDLPVYAAQNPDGKLYLARGKEYSQKENRRWEPSDPTGLIEFIRDHFDDKDDRAQFRRVIRALKRWSEIKFRGQGHGKPTGVALTVSAYNWFSPNYYTDYTGKRYYCDLLAMRGFVDSMLNRFVKVSGDYGEQAERLFVHCPVEPHDDLFKKMTNKQMKNFKEKLEQLRDALNEAYDAVDPIDACKLLREQFGDDFPVPTKPETGQSRRRAISWSSESA